MKQRNEEADANEQVLRISIDAKATVRVGPFARGGKSRVPTKAADHDFEPAATVTPMGIFLLLWTHVSSVVPQFSGSTIVDRSLPDIKRYLRMRSM